jgi:hypothetical protein
MTDTQIRPRRLTEFPSADDLALFAQKRASATKKVEEIAEIYGRLYGLRQAKKMLLSELPEPLEKTPGLIERVLFDLAPSLREVGGVVMGSSIIYLFTQKEGHTPGDIDVWVPTSHNWKPPVESGWYPHNSYFSTKYCKSDLNDKVKEICNYRHVSVSVDLQVVHCDLANPEEIKNDFDLDVCRCIWSPKLIPGTNQVVGRRATEPSIIAAVMSGVATFKHHNCDIYEDRDGRKHLSDRGMNRIDKYVKRGFEIRFDPSSAFLEAEIKTRRNAPLYHQTQSKAIAPSQESNAASLLPPPPALGEHSAQMGAGDTSSRALTHPPRATSFIQASPATEKAPREMSVTPNASTQMTQDKHPEVSATRNLSSKVAHPLRGISPAVAARPLRATSPVAAHLPRATSPVAAEVAYLPRATSPVAAARNPTRRVRKPKVEDNDYTHFAECCGFLHEGEPRMTLALAVFGIFKSELGRKYKNMSFDTFLSEFKKYTPFETIKYEGYDWFLFTHPACESRERVPEDL